MVSITDGSWVRQQADAAAAAIESARTTLSAVVDTGAVTVPAQLVRALLDATGEQRLNEIRDAAFRDGVEGFSDALMSYEWHPHSTGVWYPYARRDWDGEYGMTL